MDYIISTFAETVYVRKKTARIFGIIGGLAMVLTVLLLLRHELFPAYAFCTIALFTTYIFLIYTQSKLSVVSALMCHILGIVAMCYSGAILSLCMTYILLPFAALLIRSVWMDKLAHTLKLWIEPLLYAIAVGLYILEIRTNNDLETADARLFPIAFFLANGFMVFDVFLDGMKIKNRVKKGYGMAVGQPAPIFCLQNENMEQVCLNDYKGKHNVLLIFVRGEWCPMCHIMLRTYMKESVKFKEKNVFLLVVGPDPTGVNRRMAEELKLDFHILSDNRLTVTSQYRLKIQAEHLLHSSNYNFEKEVPLPASFLIDKQGIIRYSSNPEKIGEVVKLNDIFPILQSIDGTQA